MVEMTPPPSTLIEVKNLAIEFQTEEQIIQAVKGISFHIPAGKTIGLVGESGSGKSVTALSLMKLIPSPPGKIRSGEILYGEEKKDLLKLSASGIRDIRGNKISMIFQEPMTSLNPVFTVGHQIEETIVLHEKITGKKARQKVLELMRQVGIPHPEKRYSAYPHEMSGGQRQRIMIAMAIACKPALLIADEPTTALDVTIQKQILELLNNLQKQYGMSILFITHDLGVIAEIADRVLVMQKGKIVEEDTTQKIFNNPQHPYAQGLLACRPTLDKTGSRLPTVEQFMQSHGKAEQPPSTQPKKIKPDTETLIRVEKLSKHFPLEKSFFGKTKSWIKAVDDVSFTIQKGKTLGLVGESGCGKTTLGRTLLRLTEPTAGNVFFRDQEVTSLNARKMRELRKKVQIIFQDPYASLNPRMTIGSAIMEPMIIHNMGGRRERQKKAEELLERMELPASTMHRYPHEFSGGQRQRICIARTLSINPEFIVCDESVSALDVSIQAQILNLLLDLQEDLNLTYIFISHDLGVVKFISDHIAVMNQGKIVEYAEAEKIYHSPQQEYTQKLIAAIPKGIPAVQ